MKTPLKQPLQVLKTEKGKKLLQALQEYRRMREKAKAEYLQVQRDIEDATP